MTVVRVVRKLIREVLGQPEYRNARDERSGYQSAFKACMDHLIQKNAGDISIGAYQRIFDEEIKNC